jgi:hypothetical protein
MSPEQIHHMVATGGSLLLLDAPGDLAISIDQTV